jgi:hypothetical protein
VKTKRKSKEDFPNIINEVKYSKKVAYPIAFKIYSIKEWMKFYEIYYLKKNFLNS